MAAWPPALNVLAAGVSSSALKGPWVETRTSSITSPATHTLTDMGATSRGIRRVLVVIIAEEISTALHEGRGVVALESTIISHGLPSDSSARVARQIEAAVRGSGAVPATIAILDGHVRIGLDDSALDRIATDASVVKSSIRDLGSVLAGGVLGATTVASTAYLAHRGGIRVFATGGLGGVHRGADKSFDESADLPALAHTPVALVCAGVKSILDVRATLERLETLSVGLVGYRSGKFPGFYVQDSGYDVPWVARSVAEIAHTLAARDALGLDQALVVANPIPDGKEMARELHDATLAAALKALKDNKITGKDVTPFLLGYFHEHTDGVSLQVNIDLVLNNAALAGEIAVTLAALKAIWAPPASPTFNQLKARDRLTERHQPVREATSTTPNSTGQHSPIPLRCTSEECPAGRCRHPEGRRPVA